MTSTNKRLFDYLEEQARNHPQQKAFSVRNKEGEWVSYSTEALVSETAALSRGLLRLGLKPGDKVASVVYETSPQWIALDYAMLRLGIISVPMYPTISAREYAYILNEANVVYCFAGGSDLLEKVTAAKAEVASLRDIYTFESRKDGPCLAQLLVSGTDDAALNQKIAEISSGILPDDLATLIYTSGTTGNPKGVMLSHRNIVFNVEAMRSLIPVSPGEMGLSFLPVSHIFERAVIYAYTAYGVSTYFTTPDRLGGDEGDLRMMRPHFFTAVPRLLEKVYERIYTKGLALKGFKRWLFFWAMDLAETWDFDQKPGGLDALKWLIADKLIFSKWREALGGRLKGIIVGASACPVKIMQAFNAAGIRVREGYGMTEAAPALSFSRYEPGGAMLGTVGRILEGVQVKIEPSPDFREGEGEIIATGEGIMLGYYLQQEKTDEVLRVIDGQRWLCTGDVGTIVKSPSGNDFLKITDRKKELLKTSGGKYVAPTPIESAFKSHRLVEQVMVVGDDRKFVSALIIPAEGALKDWCEKHQVAWTNFPDMLRNEQVVRRFAMLVERVNPFFGHAEQVKKFALLPDQWEATRADGTDAELTPSLKLKRRVILKKFNAEIEQMYS